jgi:hypothetical protein
LGAIGGLAEGINDPDFTRNDSGGKGSGFSVAGDELDVLDTATLRRMLENNSPVELEGTYVWNGDSGDDGASLQVPKTKSISTLNTSGRLEDRQRDDEIGSQDDLVFKVDAQAVRRELLLKDVEGAIEIFWPLVKNVSLSIGLNKATWRSADSGAHVRDEETTVYGQQS